MTSPDKQLAKDVATNLDRRRMRRRAGGLVAAVAAIILAVLYLTCGRGVGLGSRQDDGRALGSAIVKEVARRCMIRVSAAGITVDGTQTTREGAVAACKESTGADVVVTGDARQGDWDDLRAALEAANIAVYKLGPP